MSVLALVLLALAELEVGAHLVQLAQLEEGILGLGLLPLLVLLGGVLFAASSAASWAAAAIPVLTLVRRARPTATTATAGGLLARPLVAPRGAPRDEEEALRSSSRVQREDGLPAG